MMSTSRKCSAVESLRAHDGSGFVTEKTFMVLHRKLSMAAACTGGSHNTARVTQNVSLCCQTTGIAPFMIIHSEQSLLRPGQRASSV